MQCTPFSSCTTGIQYLEHHRIIFVRTLIPVKGVLNYGLEWDGAQSTLHIYTDHYLLDLHALAHQQ